MLTPMQINSQRFNTVGKGGYKASEVDAFLQKVYKYYAKLYADNNTLNERLGAISPVIDEYNRNKTAIANALLSAQAAADSKLEAADAAAETAMREAEEKAAAYFSEKSAEADAYYIDKTKEADEKLTLLRREYNLLKTESDAYKEKYLSEIKSKVDEIISSANEKAAVIVTKAYEDARIAREKADKIIDEANAELASINEKAAEIKAELSEIVKLAQNLIDEETVVAPIEKTADVSFEAAVEESVEPVEIPEFSFKEYTEEAIEEEAVIAENTADEDVAVEELEAIGNDVESFDILSDEIDLFSHSDVQKEHKSAEIPDVNSYLSKIFDSQGDDDFGFGDLISESE